MINTMAIKNKFMGANKKSYGVMDSMILAGIPIAICYWFLESILQIFFSGKYNFIAVFFGPDLYDIYTRVTVLCLFFIFGSHAQNIINKIRETREELHESEEKYRTVADFTYDWEYWIGEKGNFEYVSPSCQRISGYRAEAFLKNPGLLNQIIHPLDRDEVSDHFRTELVRREVQSSEFRIITRDNRERWIGHVCQPVYGTDGRYRGKRASNKDITAIKNEIEERKRVEAKLEKYRDHLEDLIKERSRELLKTNAKLKAEIKERKLAQKALEASHNFLLIAFRPKKLQPLLIEFVRAIQSQTGLAAAGVQLFDTIKKAPLKYYAGFSHRFYESLSRLSMPSVQGLGTGGNRKAISSDFYSCSESGSYYINSTTDFLYPHPKERDANIIRLFNESGFESVGLIPFHLENNIYGYIHVADSRKNMINIKVLELLESGAMQLETAVKRIQAEAALQKSHRELETRVKNRTKELEVANQRLKREVAERRRAEKELKQKDLMLQGVFNGISDPLLLVGKDMTARMINRAAVENYGLNKEQISTGRFCYVATGQSDPDRKNEIPAAVAHGRNLTLERHNFVNPGRIEQVVIYPLRKKSGGNDGAIIRISDITAAKQFERRLIQSEKMASLDVLVSSIAHEINNPNNFVSFNIPILREYIDELFEIADRYTANQPKLELFHMSYPDFRKDLFKLLENIEHGADRIDAYVKNLREFYRGKDNHGQ